MFFARFLVPLGLVLSLVAWLLLPWTDRLFLDWSQTDLQMRSKLVFASIADDLPDAITKGMPSQLTRHFTELAKDERLIGIGYCDAAGVPRFSSKNYPTDVPCPAPDTTVPEFVRKSIRGGPVLIATFPVAADTLPTSTVPDGQMGPPLPPPGRLIILHDMSFAEQRSEQTRRYVLWFVLGISLLAAAITMIVAKLTLNRWIGSLRDFVRTGKRSAMLPREAVNITRDIQNRIRQIAREQQRPILTGGNWSAESLFSFVRDNMPSQQLIAVSYREPYSHRTVTDDQGRSSIVCSIPASGLVTAIEPIMKACRGTWIAVGTGDADRQTVDENDALMVPPADPAYRLKRLWLSEAETKGFYAGFANEGVWPLCNMVYVKPRFRAGDWAAYQQVNRKFADAIVAEAKSDAPIIFLQDYHFGLLPKMIREKLPQAIIVLFWHIPWPNSEIFGILPWREEFLEGMLASDIVGFHTQFHCNNFIDCVDTHVEALIDREHNTVRRGDDLCMVRPYPISIAWPDFAALSIPNASACRQQLGERLNIDPTQKIIVGVERLDYIKGIPERLRAFGAFLEKHRDWHGKVCFVQVASPSRSIIPAYAEIDQEVDAIAADINRTFSTPEWTPLHVLKQDFGQVDVYKFYRACDACIVSSLHDGMNLVAKEFVAAREDERGVLILSQFAGSSRELIDALIVNPYDDEDLAQSLLRALTMNEDEQAARLRSMRAHIKVHNVFAWAAEILGDASNLHRRRQLNSILRQHNPADATADAPSRFLESAR